MVLSMVLAAPALALDPGVSDYEIVSVEQTGGNQVTVRLQANFCTACLANDNCQPGCMEFTHGFPFTSCPYSCRGAACTPTCPITAGRYAAARIQEIGTATAYTKKLVLRNTSGPNCTVWPLGTIHAEDFVFDGVDLAAGDQIEAWGELYCSLCNHWYSCPDTLTIQAAPAIPALTDWGLIIFGIVLLGFISLVFIKRRKAAVSDQR